MPHEQVKREWTNERRRRKDDGKQRGDCGEGSLVWVYNNVRNKIKG